MRQQNRQAVTKKGIVRRLRNAGPKQFTDERDRRGLRYSLESLIGSLMLGCVAGLTSLREVEALTAGLRWDIRRDTGIGGRRSDTKLRDVLLGIDPAESRAALIRQVKAEHRRGTLEPDVLNLRVAAIDGKCLGKLDSWDDPDVQAVWPEGHRHNLGYIRTPALRSEYDSMPRSRGGPLAGASTPNCSTYFLTGP